MIVAHLQGGLGNQMFQYAMARAIARRRGDILLLDLSHYARERDRAYELDRFRIAARPLSYPRDLAGPWSRYLLARALHRRGLPAPPSGFSLVEDRFQGFDAAATTVPGHLILKGFWQSERYFADEAEAIRAELVFRESPDALNRQFLDHIGAVPSVALHVRRGDYVSQAHTAAYHGTCGLDYYEAAVADLLRHEPGAHFFVFSDDLPWVRANLRLPEATTFVEHNRGDRSAEDLRLMSRCRHAIIANSSFSWWGAWLGGRGPERRVITPRRWFADPAVSTTDLFPPGWILL